MVLNVIRLASYPNDPNLSIETGEAVEKKAIEDSILGQLKFGVPDPFGKVEIIISLDAKQVAGVLEKNGLHAFMSRINSNNALLNSIYNQSANEPSGISDFPVHPSVRILLNNPGLCGDTSQKLKYVICVNSHPSARAQRDQLRTTWASPRLFKDDTSRVVFLLGRALTDDDNLQSSVRMEFELHGDVLQGDFVDVQRNETVKGVMGLMWASRYCRQAAYVVRTNDDSFVNIFEITRIMDEHSADRWTIMCPLWQDGSMPILRDSKDCGQWCVAESEFPGMSHFPQYCASVVTIISRELVGALYRASLTTPFFWIGDVYLTGILPKKLLAEKILYVDLLHMMSLDSDAVLSKYADMSSNITIMITQLDSVEQFRTAWTSLLKRLPSSALRLLSDDTISQIT